MTKSERKIVAAARRVFNAYGSYAKWLGTGGVRQQSASNALDKALEHWEEVVKEAEERPNDVEEAIKLIYDQTNKAFRHAHSKSNNASALRAAERRVFFALMGRLPTKEEQAQLDR